MNFVTFMPRRAHVIMTVKGAKTKETDDLLDEAGFDTLAYEAQWHQYRFKFAANVADKQRETLLNLVKQARDGFGSLRGTT